MFAFRLRALVFGGDLAVEFCVLAQTMGEVEILGVHEAVFLGVGAQIANAVDFVDEGV